MRKGQNRTTNCRFENKRSLATVLVGFNIHLFLYDWRKNNSHAVVGPLKFQAQLFPNIIHIIKRKFLFFSSTKLYPIPK